MSAGLHFMSFILRFDSCRIMGSDTELNSRRPSPIPRRAEHHSVNSSEIKKFLLKINDGRDRRINFVRRQLFCD